MSKFEGEKHLVNVKSKTKKNINHFKRCSRCKRDKFHSGLIRKLKKINVENLQFLFLKSPEYHT